MKLLKSMSTVLVVMVLALAAGCPDAIADGKAKMQGQQNKEQQKTDKMAE